MTLIEAPGALDRNPELVKLIQNHPVGTKRALKHRYKRTIEAVALLLQEFTGGLGLTKAFFIQINISPAGETVFLIPSAFTMTNKDQFVHMRTS